MLCRCAKSIPVFRAITRKAEEKAAIVTSMGKVTGIASQYVSIRSRHQFLLVALEAQNEAKI